MGKSGEKLSEMLKSGENSQTWKAFQPEFGAYRGLARVFEIALEPSKLQRQGENPALLVSAPNSGMHPKSGSKEIRETICPLSFSCRPLIFNHFSKRHTMGQEVPKSYFCHLFSGVPNLAVSNFARMRFCGLAFALFCELLFALFCAHWRSFARFCVFLHPTALSATAPRLGTSDFHSF